MFLSPAWAGLRPKHNPWIHAGPRRRSKTCLTTPGTILVSGRHAFPVPGNLQSSQGLSVAQVAEISILDGQVQVHRVVCAVDCGQVVNPAKLRAQMHSGIVFELTAALKWSISTAGGRVLEGNFDDYPLLRADEMPTIDVHLVPSDAEPGGVGEHGTPPIAPALAKAVYAATDRPVRRLPIHVEAAAPGAT